MKYYVNVWQSSLNNGTCCVWKGESKRRFIEEIRKALERYPAYKPLARLAVYQNGYTIFSFSNTGESYYTWLNMSYQRKPIMSKYIRLKGDFYNEIG